MARVGHALLLGVSAVVALMVLGAVGATATGVLGSPPTLAEAVPWVAGPGEVQPEVKRTATRLVEAAGTWQDSDGDSVALASRLGEQGVDPVVAGQVTVLAHDDALAATVTVDYPQYGGLTETSASVMTLLTQRLLLPDGGQAERQMALDVRLERASVEDAWRVVAVSPDPEVPATGQGSPLAQAVLDNENLKLPGPAVRDIRDGRMDDALLRVLDGLGSDHVIDVHVLYTGHPTNVFATDRPSNHSVGRAFDVWRIDGHLVVDPEVPPELLDQVMRRAAELGATEVGGPFDLNGDRPGFFTDPVHADHIHVGVSEGRSPAQP